MACLPSLLLLEPHQAPGPHPLSAQVLLNLLSTGRATPIYYRDLQAWLPTSFPGEDRALPQVPSLYVARLQWPTHENSTAGLSRKGEERAALPEATKASTFASRSGKRYVVFCIDFQVLLES